jgi:hypothetical protein
MLPTNVSLTVFLICLGAGAFSQSVQGTKPLDNADSTYIRDFVNSNDVRLFYGGQGNRLVLGSVRDGSADVSENIYKNTNDFLGVGGSYKWVDGDVSFSLPGTTYLKEERSNLEQFRVAASYTRRQVSFRGYLSNSKGVIITGNDDEYESTPSVHEFRMGLQATYILNNQKYSYRAALYQSEKQVRTAGSFLFRGELFFRDLGGDGQAFVPQPHDVEERFGEQTGLTYVRAPGLLIMPGYGVNFVFNEARFFVSPILLGGAGVAVNTYEGNRGTRSHANMEYNAYFLLNAGYSGSRVYGRIQLNYAISYSPIQPAYLTSTTLIASVMIGYRFKEFTDSR